MVIIASIHPASYMAQTTIRQSPPQPLPHFQECGAQFHPEAAGWTATPAPPGPTVSQRLGPGLARPPQLQLHLPGPPLTPLQWGSQHTQEMRLPRNESSLAGRNVEF